jgi:YHS domain-containing protein
MNREKKDPVCGKAVNEEISKNGLLSNHKGETYYFCSMECKEKFDSSPDRHIHKGHLIHGTM